MRAFRAGDYAISRRRTAICGIYPVPNGVHPGYCFYRACPDRYTKSKKCLRCGRLPALMERVVPGARDAARRHADLVGTPVFWLTIAVTLCALVPLGLFPRMRAWLGCAVLLMWTCFFTANAVRSRRTHSIISAPVYSSRPRFSRARRGDGSRWTSGWCGSWAPASSPQISQSASWAGICRGL